MAENVTGAGGLPDGLLLQGSFVGVKAGRPFTNRQTGEQGQAKPKVGVEANGVIYSVRVPDDATLYQLTAGMSKGDAITIPVTAYPPFGARGEVTLAVRGEGLDDGPGGWD